jgi:hypothetical protein
MSRVCGFLGSLGLHWCPLFREFKDSGFPSGVLSFHGPMTLLAVQGRGHVGSIQEQMSLAIRSDVSE